MTFKGILLNSPWVTYAYFNAQITNLVLKRQALGRRGAWCNELPILVIWFRRYTLQQPPYICLSLP